MQIIFVIGAAFFILESLLSLWVISVRKSPPSLLLRSECCIGATDPLSICAYRLTYAPPPLPVAASVCVLQGRQERRSDEGGGGHGGRDREVLTGGGDYRRGIRPLDLRSSGDMSVWGIGNRTGLLTWQECMRVWGREESMWRVKISRRFFLCVCGYFFMQRDGK